MQRALYFLAVLAAGCAPQPPEQPEPVTALEIAAPFERTWAAAIDVLAGEGLPIATSDKASGVISVSSTVIRNQDGARWAQCGGFLNTRWATRGEYTVLVRPAAAGSTVRATARFVSTGGAESSSLPPTVCPSRGVWERSLHLRIKQAVEGSP